MPTILADGRRIRQVLTNLVGNAVKFTEEGYIKIAAQYDDFEVVISVEDTGIGIPEDRKHAVFEQFEQVDSSSTRRYGGTGLGLPLSREFVRLHGGDMGFESAVGEGIASSSSRCPSVGRRRSAKNLRKMRRNRPECTLSSPWTMTRA